jgi:hypothetical protein
MESQQYTEDKGPTNADTVENSMSFQSVVKESLQ